jgi:hypothetical protein
MTPEQIAAFSISNDFYMWGGVILGLILGGVFKTLKSFLDLHLQRPRRIRFGNLNGRAERKDDFEYLYLFKNEYYTLEQRDFLVKERLKKFKQMKSPLSYFFPFLCVFCIFLAALVFYSAHQFTSGL